MKKIIMFFMLMFAFFAIVSAQEIVLDTGSFKSLWASLPVITGLALLDSINPCVIGVLILLLTVLLKTGNKNAIIKNGIAYTAGVYFTYLIGGLTLLGVFNAIRAISILSEWLYFFIGTFIIFAGLLEIKDFFWYGKWYSLAIPKRFVKYIEKKASGAHASLLATFSFGVVLTLIELPCTGAPYLAVLTLMSQSGYSYISSLPLLLFYNLVFILPLIVIIYISYKGTNLKRLEGWRGENKGKMRLLVGLALCAVGIWIITAVKDLLVELIIFVGGLIALMAVVKYLFNE